MGYHLLLVCIGTPRTTFDQNTCSLKLFTSQIKEFLKNNRKGVGNLTCCYGNKNFMFSSSSHVES